MPNQQQESYNLIVQQSQQSLWYQMQMQMQIQIQMQMQMQMLTTTAANAQALYTLPSTLYRVFENSSMSVYACSFISSSNFDRTLTLIVPKLWSSFALSD